MSFLVDNMFSVFHQSVFRPPKAPEGGRPCQSTRASAGSQPQQTPGWCSTGSQPQQSTGCTTLEPSFQFDGLEPTTFLALQPLS